MEFNTQSLSFAFENIDAVSKEILTSFLDHTKASIGSLQILDNGILRTIAHLDFPDKLQNLIKLSDKTPVSEHIIQSKEIFEAKDLHSNPSLHSHPMINFKHYLCIPLLHNNEVVGIVHLADKSSLFNYSQSDTPFLMDLAERAAKALFGAQITQLKREKEVIDKDIELAETVQRTLIPINIPYAKNASFGKLFEPLRAISGDFHDFIQLDEDRLCVIFVDIVGKGISAGLCLATIKSAFSIYFKQQKSLKETMIALNNYLAQPEVFIKHIPVICLIYDSKHKTITYCNAGHDPGILVSNGKVSHLTRATIPLGALPDETEFEETTVQLQNGDIVLLFSDGISETKNYLGKDIGSEWVETYVTHNATKPIQTIINEIALEIHAFNKNAFGQKDDISMVGLKIDDTVHDKTTAYPNDMTEYVFKSTSDTIESVEKTLESKCMRLKLSQAKTNNLFTVAKEILEKTIKFSYNNAQTGKILVHTMVYDDRLVVSFRDFGKKNAFSITNGDLVDTIRFVERKEGSYIFITQLST